MAFVIAIGFILLTIPAIVIYVFILIIPEVLVWLLTFDVWLLRATLLP